MDAIFRPEAEEEMLEARTWYEAKSPGLGLEFARAVESALHKAERHPAAYLRVAGECRRILLRRFPYMLVFLPQDGGLIVVACFHQRRDPGSLQARLSRES